MSPSRPKKPPDPGDVSGRVKADGIGRALQDHLPAEDSGLGPVGEQALAGLLDEADRDEEQYKTLMRFTPRWRKFIRRQDEIRLDAADDLIDDWLERKALRRFWLRIGRFALFLGPVVIGWASGFFERVVPLLHQAIKIWHGTLP